MQGTAAGLVEGGVTSGGGAGPCEAGEVQGAGIRRGGPSGLDPGNGKQQRETCGRFSEANNRHGGAEDSGEWQDEEGSARELGGVWIQARETFGSCFLPDRSGGSGDLGTWRSW